MSGELLPDERVDIEFTYVSSHATGSPHGATAAASGGDVEMADAPDPGQPLLTDAVAERQGLINAGIGHLNTLLAVCLECSLSPDRCQELKALMPSTGASAQALVQVCFVLLDLMQPTPSGVPTSVRAPHGFQRICAFVQ